MSQLLLQLSPNESYRLKILGSPILSYISRIDSKKLKAPRFLHAHDDIVEIFYIYEGKGQWFIDNFYYPVEAGNVVVVHQSVIHDEWYETDTPISFYCLGLKHVRLDFIQKMSLFSKSEGPVLSLSSPNLIQKFCTLTYEMLEEKPENYQNSIQFLLQGLLCTLEGSVRPTKLVTEIPESLAIVGEIKSYIDTHYTENITLNLIESMWRINRYYFSHKFKEHYRYSPIDYLNRRRIGEAQTLLLTTDLPVNQIADQVGFSTNSYFNKLFKKEMNMTPLVYRKTQAIR